MPCTVGGVEVELEHGIELWHRIIMACHGFMFNCLGKVCCVQWAA